MNGAGASIGSGPQQAFLAVTDASDEAFGSGHGRVLSGVVTYSFTPAGAPVPEPSTWAMMLVGFAGLGYAAVRGNRTVHAISA
jgi:PEP-CTERM motif